MGDLVTCKIEGLDELVKAFKDLSSRQASAAIRAALVESGEIVEAAVEEEAPRESEGPDAGLLANNIGVKVKVRAGQGYALIGPKRGVFYSEGRKSAGAVNFITRGGKRVAFAAKAGAKISISHITRFLEFGTSKMSADPFISRAWSGCEAAVQARFVEKLRERLHL